jgi:drug/metabolite transporter (DMT)-like permease
MPKESQMKTMIKTGHFVAFITIIIWATTFISTKILLLAFQPVEILFFRFVLGFVALLLVYPHRLRLTDRKQELYFAAAGLSGVCVYYLLENTALTYTQASNVGVIISTAPFFTAILSRLIFKNENKLQSSLFIGFVVAMIGVFLISFQGTALRLNPLGDLLALLAALVWACYSVAIKKIGSFGYNTIQTTRRIFAYGLVFMIPTLFLFDFNWDISRFSNSANLFHIMFLGFGASALCFVTWNFAVKVLGPIKTSIYIYLVPAITAMASVWILHEQITWTAAIGISLTITGLFLSEAKPRTKEELINESRN